MTTLLLILSSIVLTAAIIWCLHKYQIRKTLEIAESSKPLSPLDIDTHAPAIQQRREVNVMPEIGLGTQPNRSWSDEIKSLRDSGYYKEALALSKRQYPRMLAFRQSLITLRARLRQEPGQSEESLRDLYQTAVLGDLVRVSNKSDKTIADIESLTDRLKEPQVIWNTLGYRNLELLTKTDCKLLVQHWGEPRHHDNIDNIF